MANIQTTNVLNTGYVKLPNGTTAQRPGYTVIQWTNTGSQAYNILAGPTPTLSNTTWTAPTGVTSIEVLVESQLHYEPQFLLREVASLQFDDLQ